MGYQSSDIGDATPRMNALALDGVRLTSYYGQASCTPARATLLSGKWAHRIGLQDTEIEAYSNFSVPLRHTLLPQRLHSAGYATYGLGKWNLGHCNLAYMPWNRGFDSFLGYFSGGADYTSRQAGTFQWGLKTELMLDLVEGNASAPNVVRTGADYGFDYDTLIYHRKALSAIAAHSAAGERGGQPFFLWLALHTAHADHGVINETALSVEDRATMHALSERVDVTSERLQFAKAMMLADSAIGDIATAAQSDEALRDTTLLVVHSDNGAQSCTSTLPGSNTPLRSMKFQYFEGGIRVPAFIWAPKGAASLLPTAARGGAYGGLMHHVDWTPTLLRLSGAFGNDETDAAAAWSALAKEESLDGVDQWGAMLEGAISSATTSSGHSDGASDHAPFLPSTDAAATAGGGGNGAAASSASPRTEIVFDISALQFMSGRKVHVGFALANLAYRAGDLKLMTNTTSDGWYFPEEIYSTSCNGRKCKAEFSEEANAGASTYANCSYNGWLFDVVADPTERVNLFNDPAYYVRRQSMEARLMRMYETEWQQYSDWDSTETTAARTAFYEAGNYIVPWGCDTLY